MSMLRYEHPATEAPAHFPADQALLRLLLIAGGALLSLVGWVSAAARLLPATAANDLLLTGCGLTQIGSTAAVLHWVLRPLWPRRYEGSAGVWGVMFLSPLLLLLLVLVCGFCCLVLGLARD